MPGPLLAVDAPFLLYRSHFAMPESVLGVDDRPIGALLGATNVILRIAAERAPRAIVFCFGAEAAHYRVELYPPYHADRPAPPAPLAWEFEVAPGYFEQFGWTATNTPDFEADDLLHSLAATETEAGGRTLLLTGDRDMYQCASDTTHVLRLKPGGPPGGAEIDPDEVQKMYGIPPKLVPDFIALRGDPSDGLPGASGIGPKTAAELLQRHGSLDAAITNAELERPRVAAALRDQAPELLAFRAIATLRDVDTPRPPDRATDLEGGARAARAYGMRRLSERLEQAERVEDL
jgi:5'-3' exonuclease